MPENFTDTYQSFKPKFAMDFRSFARNMALTALSVRDRFTGIGDYLDTPRVQFIYIHHSFKDELIALDQLLHRLSINHTFISYGDAVDKVIGNKIDKPYVSISSDDGFKNNLLAAEILNRYNAKACFFINPGLVGERDFEKVSNHCRGKLHLPPVEFMNWDDIARLMSQGHEIGGHTMFHDDIAKLDSDNLLADLKQTFDLITEKCGIAKHFAFPYGRFNNFSEHGRKAVFDTGFVSCASAERGCHFNSGATIPFDRLCIRRDHVILDWNINHILYFLANNVRKKNKMIDTFPYSLK